MKAYAIKDPKGDIIISSPRISEGTCKSNYSEHRGYWHILEDKGFRCVPVEITEIKK